MVSGRSFNRSNLVDKEVYYRSHSAAWITPEGRFIPLGEDSIHDDYTSNFGIQRFIGLYDSGKASRIAINMGYAKVSSLFAISIDKIRGNDPRLTAMAQFVAEGIVEFHDSKLLPLWMQEKYKRMSPLSWPVSIVLGNGDIDQMTAEELIFSYGSQETQDRVKAVFKMNVNLIRQLIQETIKRMGDEWAVYPKKGGKRLGTHKSKASALRQLRAIEISKSKR
jgi:hypothetical protein